MRRLVALTTALLLQLPLTADFQGSSHITPFDDPPISYSDTTPANPVTDLIQRIESGETKLTWDDTFGYLPSVLDALDIDPSSQTLVGTKSSLHRHLISPQNPRALYFNDHTYVGWIRWAPVLEIAVTDPQLGAVFYVLSQTKDQDQRFVRNNSCLECHVSSKSMGVPGHLFRSFHAGADGTPDDLLRGPAITQAMPWKERWGGWFVTGDTGKMQHLGNVFGAEEHSRKSTNAVYGLNLPDLEELLPDTPLFAGPSSDILPLLVLTHQIHLHNFITRIHHDARRQISQYGEAKYLDGPIDAFVKQLLFIKEQPLLCRIEGSPEFKKHFEDQGPFDSQHRSLRQFDLYTRVFKFPCSYLIYSDAFQALPGSVKGRIYREITGILSNPDHPAWDNVWGPPTSDREAALEILNATLPDFPTR